MTLEEPKGLAPQHLSHLVRPSPARIYLHERRT